MRLPRGGRTQCHRWLAGEWLEAYAQNFPEACQRQNRVQRGSDPKEIQVPLNYHLPLPSLSHSLQQVPQRRTGLLPETQSPPLS